MCMCIFMCTCKVMKYIKYKGRYSYIYFIENKSVHIYYVHVCIIKYIKVYIYKGIILLHKKGI